MNRSTISEQRDRVSGQQAAESLASFSEDHFLCVIAANEHGRYCVPAWTLGRPASRAIMNGDVWEPDTLAEIARSVSGGDVVHAGTFFGDFLPVISGSLDDASVVWAFEPVRQNFVHAEVTVQLNGLGNVRLRNAGLSDAAGGGEMKTRGGKGRALGGGSRLVDGGGGDESVELVAIDDIVPGDRHVSVIQLDVEGHEEQALRGGMQTIERCLPTIILESVPDSSEWFRDTFAALGYEAVATVHGNTVYKKPA